MKKHLGVRWQRNNQYLLITLKAATLSTRWLNYLYYVDNDIMAHVALNFLQPKHGLTLFSCRLLGQRLSEGVHEFFKAL